ncbi:MAG: hypothetical protein II820_02060 [Ruminiclostridium sp.]|nr:hypothetical protein [Ruminiclostridium sp.]
MSTDAIIGKFGLDDTEKAAFYDYIANRFEGCEENPEPDESFLQTWESIISYAGIFGAAKAVNERICRQRPTEFCSPEKLEMSIYSSFAGRIPVIFTPDTRDFEQLVTNIAYKGVRPENISQTGASFLHGKSTRFMILSAKPYSNVPASELGLDDGDKWAEMSFRLRRAHECTHYFTKQVFGVTNNILHDEIMADFIGIYEAAGFYRAEWFLRFMGIIKGSGERLVFYTSELSPKVRDAVSELLAEAAYKLEAWSLTPDFAAMTNAERIKLMCRKGLAGIAQMM